MIKLNQMAIRTLVNLNLITILAHGLRSKTIIKHCGNDA